MTPSTHAPARPAADLILIVEDSPTQAAELQYILEQHGYRTAIAANGRMALEWLSRTTPAMVISDILMPEMNGYELCRAMHRDDRLKRIPVVLLSFLSNAGDVLEGLESGASNFIIKPYHTEHLIAYVRERLSGNGEEMEDRSPTTLEYEGRAYRIPAGGRQILDALLSTYGTAVRKNEELIAAETELRLLNEHLEEKVRERTAALAAEVAERRRVEEELKAYSEKLERTNEELKNFVHVASHDLQEPLRKIQTFSLRIQSKCTTDIDETLLDSIRRMQNSANRMQSQVRALLEYSRIAANREPFCRVKLQELVEALVLQMREELEESEAHVEVSALPEIEGNASQIRYLFEHLIRNGMKFRRDARPLIRIRSEILGETCTVFVEDNGIGFDEQHRDRIFKPFQQLHGKGDDGPGMGLAICRRIVEHHNGSITARSRPGEGTTFIMSLPLHQKRRREQT